MCARCACAWALDPDWTLSPWPRYLRLVSGTDDGVLDHGPIMARLRSSVGFCHEKTRKPTHPTAGRGRRSTRVVHFWGNYSTGGDARVTSPGKVPSAPCVYPCIQYMHRYFGRCQVLCETRAGIPSCFLLRSNIPTYSSYLLQSWVHTISRE